MAKGHKPVSGSRGYWPRKRAKRIYPRLKYRKEFKETVPLGFAGYKVGMTRVKVVDSKKGSPTQGQEVVTPVTVLEVPGLTVVGIEVYRRTKEGLKNYTTVWVDKIPEDLKRKGKVPENPKSKNRIKEIENKLKEEELEFRLLVKTNPKGTGLGKKKPEVFEIPIGGSPEEEWKYAKEKLGKELNIGDVFSEGEFIDVIGITKGKGTQGPVKRFGIKIRPRKHEKKRRHVGTLGPWHPARVLPGKLAMAGQMGYQRRTEHNKKILQLGDDGMTPEGGWVNYGQVKGSYVLVKGSVPGPKKRLVMLRKSIKHPGEREKAEVKKVIMESQQGV